MSDLIVTVLKVNGFITTLGVGLILQGILNTAFQGSAGSVPWSIVPPASEPMSRGTPASWKASTWS